MLALYAQALELEGIVTVMITLLPDVTEKAKVPRVLHVPFRLGRPAGEPFEFETRREVLKQLIELATLPSGTCQKYKEPIGSDLNQ